MAADAPVGEPSTSAPAQTGASPHRPARKGPPPPVVLLLVVLALLPVFLWNRFAQDAVPFVVAGELVVDEPEEVYSTGGDIFVTPPRFAARSCEVSPRGTDCANQIVAFVGPPTALPVAIVTAALGPRGGPFLLRCIGVGSLVVGLWMLRRRVIAVDPRADGYFLAMTILLIPMFMVPTALGQTSTLFFLSAALGLRFARGSGWRALAVGALWGLTVAIKVSPIALAVILVWRRQWAVLGAGLAVVAASFLVVLPLGASELMEPFQDFLVELEDTATQNPYNGALESAVHAVAPDFSEGGSSSAVLWGVRGLVALALAWVGLRMVDEDVQWAWAWSACLLFVPLVWWHYVWVTIAGLVLALAGRPKGQRHWGWLVGAAAATVPMSLVNGTENSLPVAQFLFLLVGTVLISIWAVKAKPTSWVRPPEPVHA